MVKRNLLRYLAPRLWGRVKKEGRTTYYLCFLPIFKKVTREFRKEYYLFCVRVFCQPRLTNIIQAEVAPALKELRANNRELKRELNALKREGAAQKREVSRLTREVALLKKRDLTRAEELKQLGLENKIMYHHFRHRQLAKPRYILLFDCLCDENAEAIDAWSMFCYLQSRNIPAKYVLMRANKLAESQQDNPDVVLVADVEDFFTSCQELIAGARAVLTSFGFRAPYHKFLKRLPFLQYIFIEHGVTLLKESVLRIYHPVCFDKILVSSKATYELYCEKSAWKQEDMIFNGMPRWDLLSRKPHAGKNIFVFFTWRRSFKDDAQLARGYFEKLSSFLNNPALLQMLREHDVTINLAFHHALALNQVELPRLDEHINIIEMTDISRHIGTTDLLVTDYSSICFDFMYLDIPVLFYRFLMEWEGVHPDDIALAETAQRYDERFYNCVYQEEDALAVVERYVRNGFVLEEENKRKNEAFFWSRQNIRGSLYEQVEALCRED